MSETLMKRCPDCGAPNPSRLAVCHYCGQKLDAPRRGAPLPGQPTFPCANCEGLIPIGARACPHCGRITTPPKDRPSSPIGLPGWAIRPLPDGTIALRRPAWSGMSQGNYNPLGAGLIAYYGFMIAIRIFSVRSMMAAGGYGAPWPLWQVILLLLPLIGLAAGGFLWLVLGRQEIRVGQNLLEVRWVFGKWRKVWRVSDGILLIQRFELGGDRPRFRLMVRGQGGQRVLDTAYAGPYNELHLFPNLVTPVPSPMLVDLGRFLAEQTGWMLDVPPPPSPSGWS